MRGIAKVLIAVAFGALSACPCLTAAQAQKTDKIRLLSFYKIDGEWIFNVLDFSANKKLELVNGEDCLGYAIKTFDEDSQTAEIKTPNGLFLISTKLDPAADRGAENFDIPSSLQTATRRQILDNLK